MSHTQGKLTIKFRNDNSSYMVIGNMDSDHKQFDIELDGLYPSDVADARRLVACWNAAQGLSTEFLENAAKVSGEPIKTLITGIEQERDELLAALERLISAYSNSHSPSVRQDCWDHARRAIANVKGEA